MPLEEGRSATISGAALEPEGGSSTLHAPTASGRTPPSTIGRYRILRELGRGGMGTVYQGYDEQLNRPVAVKVLHGKDEGVRAQLHREAQNLARLSHPNVVTVYEVGLDAQRVFVAMQYIEGQTLAQWLRSPHSYRAIIDVFLDAAKGLSAAHARGVVHRDFKPGNVMVDASGRARVVDFGIAYVEDDWLMVPSDSASSDHASSGSTRGMLAGTPQYMAPEQHAGGTITPATDQFAFCVSLWRALYQQPAFAAGGRNMVTAKQAGNIRSPPRGASVPRGVQRALRRGLAPDPADRFASMADLMRALTPRGRGRAWMVFGGAAVATLAAGLWPATDAQDCDGAEARVLVVWNTNREDDLAARFAASPLAYADDTWIRVGNGVERYAKRWAETHRTVCETAPPDRADLDKRMTCLGQQMAQLSTLLEVLSVADEKTLETAVESVAELPAPERCASDPLDSLTSNEHMLDPTLAPQVFRELRSARAKRTAGKPGDSLIHARAAAEQVALLDAPALELAVHLELGECLLQTAAYDEAVEVLQTAFFEARQRNSTSAVTIAIRIADGHSGAARHEEALAWLRHARSEFERTYPGADVELTLRSADGAVLLGKRDFDAARDKFEAAVEFGASHFGEADARLATPLQGLGIARVELGHIAEARVAYTRALEIQRKFLGPGHPQVADTMATHANTFLYTGEYEEAARRLRAAYTRQVAGRGPIHPSVANTLGNLAVALIRLGKYEEAQRRLLEAIAIVERSLGEEHPHVAYFLGNLGSVTRQLGDPQAARRHYERAIAILEVAEGADSLSLVQLLINLGNILAAQQLHDVALRHHQRAISIASRHLGREHPVFAHASTAAATSLTALERPVEAVALLEPALAILMLPHTDDMQRAEARIRLADALWASHGDRERARRLAVEAANDAEASETADTTIREQIDGWLAAHPGP